MNSRAEEDDDIKILGTHHRAKLLQFHTDVRPAYFGTWRKESVAVRARRPLGLDKELFDYEVDSADEWEEEEPGESVDSGDEVMKLGSSSWPLAVFVDSISVVYMLAQRNSLYYWKL